MTNDVKLRLFVSVIVVVMATLYVGPLVVTSHFGTVEQTLLQDCRKVFTGSSFEFCWDQSRRDASLPFWEYLLPYFPAGITIWVNWLVKPDFRLSEQTYPKRTINVLMWFGLFVAAMTISLSFFEVVSKDIADLYKIRSRSFWVPSFVSAAWLMSPMLFHHLVAPISRATDIRKCNIGLWLVAATPVASFALYLIREAIKV